MAQLWLFEDELKIRPTRPHRPAGPARPRRPRPRVRPLACSRLIPSLERFITLEAQSPEMRILLGSEQQTSDLERAGEMTRRERIDLRNNLKTKRRDERHRMPREAREILRQDELSCEMLEMLDGWLGRPDNTRWTDWLDRWVAQGTAQVRALWSRAEERNRRTGLTADELDPNEHVLPPSLFGLGGRDGGMDE